MIFTLEIEEVDGIKDFLDFTKRLQFEDVYKRVEVPFGRSEQENKDAAYRAIYIIETIADAIGSQRQG